MDALTPQIRQKGFQNWLKGALALLFTKQALDEFVDVELTQFQKNILASIFSKYSLSQGTTCKSCTTENVLSCPTTNFCQGRSCKLHDINLPYKAPQRVCPNNICQDIRDGIRRAHRYNGPSWRNTDASGWCTEVIEIAKCFMPPDGYFAASDLADIDFNGTISIIINNKLFDSKMTANLEDKLNICTKAKEVGNIIRHAADMSITDAELTKYIDILIALLSDTKYLASDSKAQEGVNKLNQLKANTLTITTADITTVLDEDLKSNVARIRQTLNTEREEIQERILDDVKVSLDNMEKVTMNRLVQIVDKGIKEFNKVVQKGKEEISSEAKLRVQEEFGKRKGHQSACLKEEETELETFMRDDLINFYRKYQNTIPLSPIVEEHDASLAEFYVQPPLYSVDVQKFGLFQDSHARKKLHSLQDLFLQSSGQVYKDIYITAKAGVGKTSFVKRILMMWCQAHSCIENVGKNFKREDIEMMEKFEFLFMVSLRDITTPLCRVDDMIKCQIINNLARYQRYSDTFLADLLHEKNCLIVLDGLDEWSHPKNCSNGCRKEQRLPQRPARKNCAILTTTRPWKLDVLKLNSNQIDRHVEITELDQRASKQLISNAVSVLNRRSLSHQSKSSEDFQILVSSKMFDSLRYIPYILLQMICVWFDGGSLGKSKSEIYSNTLELTLTRGLMKLGEQDWRSEKMRIFDNETFPRCILPNELCKSHYDLILTLGRIAYDTLFCLKRESTIVFDASIVLERIPEYTLQFCLDLGILSQTKDWRLVASRSRKLSFQHKTIQEYLAALYIHSDPDSMDMKKRLMSVCKSIAAILEMSNTFVFLGGLSPSACGKTLQLLQQAVSSDETIIYYRENLLIKESVLSEYWKTKEAIRAFQYMQIDIAQEIQNSGQKEFPLSLEDIIIDNTLDSASYPVLETLVNQNKDNIKSLYVRDVRCTEEFIDIVEKTGLKDLQKLQKLVFITVPPPDILLSFLSNAVSTLKCLRLSFIEFRDDNLYYSIDTTLSHDSVQTICKMDLLKTVMLSNVRLAHPDLKDLFDTLGRKSTMTEVALYQFTCTDHGNKCDGELLDLSQHSYLKMLDLDNIPVAELRVADSALSECLIGEDKYSVFPSWLESLRNAKNLQSLFFRRMTPKLLTNLPVILPQLAQLKNFGIEITDLGDMTPTLPSESNIKSVYFYQVKMTSAALKCFAESAAELSHPVKVVLEWCNVTPLKEYEEVKEYIKISPKYRATLDGVNYRYQNQFEFETVAEALHS